MLMGREKAYRADHLTDHTTGTTGRKGIQYIDSPLEPCHEPAIISPEVADSLGLLLWTDMALKEMGGDCGR